MGQETVVLGSGNGFEILLVILDGESNSSVFLLKKKDGSYTYSITVWGWPLQGNTQWVIVRTGYFPGNGPYQEAPKVEVSKGAGDHKGVFNALDSFDGSDLGEKLKGLYSKWISDD